jgi:phosphoribosyl-AMP cyclohydrolase
LALIRRGRQVTARQSRSSFIPLKGFATKGLRGAAWILAESCGYPATKPQGNGAGRQQSAMKGLFDMPEHDAEREAGLSFLPKFDSAGLLSAVVQDADSGEVLMVAFMDREALEATRRTGFAHFHSRSRGRLWKKGESSGHVLAVEAILVDCDQDSLVLKARPAGPACHTGARSCFYRALEGETLVRLEG